MRTVLLLCAGMAIGLVLGGALMGHAVAQQQQGIAPPPPPPRVKQPPPSPGGTKFGYHCTTDWSHRYWSPEVVDALNDWGRKGWRWMGPLSGQGNGDVYCFERTY
jgi:hypothetical protein